MLIVGFIRHGETEWNQKGLFQGQTDIPLNDRGREQARESAEAICHMKWDLIVSSPLSRAYETAQIIASELSLNDIYVVDEFMECAFGAAEGVPYNQIHKKYPDGDIPGKESLNDLHERVCKGIDQVVNEHEGLRVLVVAHACVLNSLLYHLSDGQLGTQEIPEIENGYVATLSYQEPVWTVIDVSVA